MNVCQGELDTQDEELQKSLERIEQYMRKMPNYLEVPIPESLKKGGVLCGGPAFRKILEVRQKIGAPLEAGRQEQDDE